MSFRCYWLSNKELLFSSMEQVNFILMFLIYGRQLNSVSKLLPIIRLFNKFMNNHYESDSIKFDILYFLLLWWRRCSAKIALEVGDLELLILLCCTYGQTFKFNNLWFFTLKICLMALLGSKVQDHLFVRSLGIVSCFSSGLIWVII